MITFAKSAGRLLRAPHHFSRIPALLLSIELPQLHELMTTAVVSQVHAAPGDELAVGAPILDLRVDLSHAAAHDCPPVSFFRVVSRERGVLRTLTAAKDSEIVPGERIGLLATTADDLVTAEPARAARLTTVGVLGPEAEW